jgi:hypothetical protein
MRWLMMAAVGLTLLGGCAASRDPTYDALAKRTRGVEPLSVAETKLVNDHDAYLEEIRLAGVKRDAEQAREREAVAQTERDIADLRAKRDAGKKLTPQQTARLAKVEADDVAAKQLAERQKQAAIDAQETYLPPSEQNCGLIGCISSPYTQAKLYPQRNGSGIDPIGQPTSFAIGKAGVPDATTTVGAVSYLTWRRTQRDGGSMYSCEETIAVKNGKIGGYRFIGNC